MNNYISSLTLSFETRGLVKTMRRLEYLTKTCSVKFRRVELEALFSHVTEVEFVIRQLDIAGMESRVTKHISQTSLNIMYFNIITQLQVTSLNNQLLSLTEERDKALVEAEDLGIKLANSKYELNRLQREHIKLQLEQEKVVEKFELFRESSKKGEEEKLDVNEKSGIVTGKEKMDRTEYEVKMWKISQTWWSRVGSILQ